MTTTALAPEILESVEVSTYEPTVQDKIQRVLYRLEHGERLISGQLKLNDNFCILGLFTDESGMGHWDIDYRYIIDATDDIVDLNLTSVLVKYYGFADPGGSFALSDLPTNDMQNKVKCLLADGHSRITSDNMVFLSVLNDLGDFVKYPYINQLLADIIRSGAPFQPYRQDQGDYCDDNLN